MAVLHGLLTMLYYAALGLYYLSCLLFSIARSMYVTPAITVTDIISLHSAAKSGDVDKVRELLLNLGVYGANCIDENSRSLLHHALIDEYKAVKNVMDRKGDALIHVAARKGHDDVVLFLIKEFHFDPNIKGHNGISLLHIACYRGNLSLVKMLIGDHNADWNATDSEGEAPIHVAARCGHTDIVVCLVDDYGGKAKTKGKDGRTVLHEACQSGNITLVQTLTKEKYDVDINAEDVKHRSPLYIAIASNNFEIAAYLIKNLQCNCKVRDINGKESRSQSLVDHFVELLKSPAMSTASVDSGDYAHEVSQHSNIKPWNDDGIGRANFGKYLLHKACELNNIWLVNTLIKDESLDPLLLTDSKGNTALHIASCLNHPGCIEALLDVKPLLPQNNSGLTPIDVAKDEAKELLLQYKASNIEMLKKHDAYLQYAKKRYPGKYSVTHVFVIGNVGAGKSTLIESLKRGFKDLSEQVSFVPPHTAGIIPSVHMDQQYGRVCFYDFAGDPVYYSSHAAILERLASQTFGHHLFIITVDLRKNDNEIERTLHYWVSFIQYQKFSGMRLSLVVVGSHADLISADRTDSIAQTKLAENLEDLCRMCKSYLAINHDQFACYTLDCRHPSQFHDLMENILYWKNRSPAYPLYPDLSLLIGVLEMDFKCTACPMKKIQSYIEDNGICLATKNDRFLPIITALHVAGFLLILNLNSKINDRHVVLDCSELTNKLHESLFSTEKPTKLHRKIASFNVGIIPSSVIKDILPSGITEDCLVQLQFCQRISYKDIPCFHPSLTHASSEDNFFFFPALCTADKLSIQLEDENLSYSISWLAMCSAESWDYFPPRFLHVLLLRLVFRFTLPVPPEYSSESNYEFQRRCTMWKTGMSWLRPEGVKSTVELVKGNRGVVVICFSPESCSRECVNIFSRVVDCIMEVKSEFCHSIKLCFYRLDTVDEADYLNKDRWFSESELQRDSGPFVISVSGKRMVKREKLLGAHKLTHWHSLFPLDFKDVFGYLEGVVKELGELAMELGIRHAYEEIEEDYPHDIRRRRYKLVKAWMNTPVSMWMDPSVGPPCWWRLVQAVEKWYSRRLAHEIVKEHSHHVELQKVLLEKTKSTVKPDNKFLTSFAEILGPTWSSLAASMNISESEVEEMKKNKPEEQALCMMKQWASRENSTYHELLRILMTFHYPTNITTSMILTIRPNIQHSPISLLPGPSMQKISAE